MEATIVDLRYNMKEVLKALNRNEKVTVLYHGKEKAVIIPIQSTEPEMKITDHPFFGRDRCAEKSVEAVMDELRGNRYK